MLNKTIDDKTSVCVCECVLQILIMKAKILPFSNYNVRIYNSL
jgi:hypothetical protein